MELEAQELAKLDICVPRLPVDSVPDGYDCVVAGTRMSRMEEEFNSSSNERKRVRKTRAALVQQLAELEALEVKQNKLVS